MVEVVDLVPGVENDCMPRVDLAPALRPVAPPHGLLETPGVVVERGSGRWLGGVNLVGYPEDTPTLWTDQSVGTYLDKATGGDVPSATFDMFVAYLPVSCKVFDRDLIQEQSVRALQATISFAAEQALSQGIGDLANPYLGDSNVDALNSGSAVTPQVGLSYLEDAIGGTGRQGMIHATPSVVAAWDVRPEYGASGGLYSANGTRIVSGGGYIGASANGSAAAAGQSWVFATGPVEVYLSDPIIQDVRTSLDRSDNSITFRAEQAVLVIWDTALQAAVLVDWTP